jgi:hypothetical protein
MSDLNDVIFDLGGVERIAGTLPVSASDAEITAHLGTNCEGPAVPSLAQVKSHITPYLNARTDALNAQAARKIADTDAINTAIASPVIQYLNTHTPQECADYVAGILVGLPAPIIQLQQHYAIALCVLMKDKLRS